MFRPLILTLLGLSLGACTAAPSQPAASPTAKTCLMTSSNPLDWAIDGPGYFTVLDPANGKRLFTRKGQFKFTPNGEVATAEGYLLDPAVAIYPGTTTYRIERDGTVMAAQPGKTEVTETARVMIFRFAKPDQLKAEGNGYFTPTTASGAAESGQPTFNGFSAIQGKALEATSCS